MQPLASKLAQASGVSVPPKVPSNEHSLALRIFVGILGTAILILWLFEGFRNFVLGDRINKIEHHPNAQNVATRVTAATDQTLPKPREKGKLNCEEIRLTGPFYHATKREFLEGIMKPGLTVTENENNEKIAVKTHGINVKQVKVYKGAFVSTRPELYYGDYILVFNNSIKQHKGEKNRDYSHIDTKPSGHKWIAFQERISVNDRHLSHILLAGGARNELEGKKLEQDLKAWTGREIRVEFYDASKFPDIPLDD